MPRLSNAAKNDIYCRSATEAALAALPPEERAAVIAAASHIYELHSLIHKEKAAIAAKLGMDRENVHLSAIASTKP